MANPSGGTFHYTQERLNQPGYPGIVRQDGSRASPAPARGSGFLGSVSGMVRDHPCLAFFGAVAVGYLASCLASRA